jgi:quercetin dioxygenase-like cupin family protein
MNLKNAFLSLGDYFSPRIIGEVNDQYIKVVKIKGQEVPWHNHENEDELFYIAKVDGLKALRT